MAVRRARRSRRSAARRAGRGPHAAAGPVRLAAAAHPGPARPLPRGAARRTTPTVHLRRADPVRTAVAARVLRAHQPGMRSVNGFVNGFRERARTRLGGGMHDPRADGAVAARTFGPPGQPEGTSYTRGTVETETLGARETDTREVEIEALLLEAREQERAVLAAELHDGPAQQLTNIGFQVQIIERALSVDPATARDELHKLRADLERELERMREFIHQLHPA